MREASSLPRYCSSSYALKPKKSGSALSVIGSRRLLGLVDDIREGEVVHRREPLHVVEGVLAVGLAIVCMIAIVLMPISRSALASATMRPMLALTYVQ